MSRQSSANHNSRPASTYQSVNQQLSTPHSREPNNESVTGTSDLYRSSNDYGRVRESRNVFGKYLSSRGRQERKENKEFANSLQEKDRVFAENRRKELEGKHRDEEMRRRKRSERISREEDKVQEERRALAIERNGGWYQHDLEREEEMRPQREISRTIAASPPSQRLQKKRQMANRTEEERSQWDKSREEERARQRNRLKREHRIQEGEILRENYRYREGERPGECLERGFDVQGKDFQRWALGLTYRPNDYPVVPLCDRVGSRPSIPLPRQRPSGPQIHRPAPPPLPPPSQSSQPPRLPRPPQPHQTPQSPQSAPPRRRCRPAPSSHYNTNPPPRIKIEHIASPPPRRSRYHHNPDPPEPRSSSRGRSYPPTSKHSLTKSNIAQHNKNRHSFLNNNPAATKDSRSKHNENKNPSINPPIAKKHSKPKPKDKKFISRTSRIKTSGRVRVKDCVQVGAVVGRAGADVGRVLWNVVTTVALAIED
ncbi:hypothetical protein BHYA_0369g00070 [Botrytis hyacinthi]|uniref:Uncharacterized protein n=1 Tax=Botrytis hyacinthi TaxID=278943 RepID=A0A4Z1G951_9HELO|nr:hypothetical protein BHYA_0369g00070 [Botrytis hyacinthi]